MSYIEYVTGEHDYANPLEDLARANGFTMADLEENRKGKISDSQWGHLLLSALRPVRYTGGALLGWLLACLVVKTFVPDFILWIVAIFGGKSIGAVFGVVTLTCAGAFLVSVLKCGHSMVLLLADLKAGQSACLEGRVSASREEERGLGIARLYGDKHTHHWYVVRNEYFEVDEDASTVLPPGGQFRLYHTPKSKLLLSIEPK